MIKADTVLSTAKALPASEFLRLIGPMREKLARVGARTVGKRIEDAVTKAVGNPELAARYGRDEAISAYTMEGGLDDGNHLYSMLNAMLRRITVLEELTIDEVAAAMEDALGDLWPYAEVLMDAIRKLDPSEPKTLYRGGKLDMAALEFLKGQQGHALAFTVFASFSESPRVADGFVDGPKAGGPCEAHERSVLWVLESAGRPKIGRFSVLGREAEVICPPGSTALLVGVEELDRYTEVRLRDLAPVEPRLGKKREARTPRVRQPAGPP
jgi:hypothetical protein